MAKIRPLVIIFGFVFAFLAGCLAVWSVSKHMSVNAPQSTPQIKGYHAQKLTPQNTDITTKYIGYVMPVHDVDVKPYISGFIEKIYVKGGETVRQGDVLLVLKQDEYLASLKAAEADILKASANLQNTLTYFERIKKAGNAVSASELEDAKAAYLSAVADLEQAKASYKLAKVNYDYTFMTASIDGVVGDVNLTRGNYVSPSTPSLLHIVQNTPMRVVFSISDKQYLEELKKEKPFENEKIFLRLPNGDIYQKEGVFKYTDNSLDKSTTSMPVYADFDNIGKTLTPNTYVTVLVVQTLKNVVEVKKNLVTMEEAGNFVYLIRDGHLIKAPVKIMATQNDMFALQNTFEKQDLIVTDDVRTEDIGQPAEVITNARKA